MKINVALLDCEKRPGGIALVLVLAALLLSCAPAHAQEDERQQEGRGTPPHAAGHRARGGGPASLFRQLNLTPEQLAQLKEIRRQSEGEGRELARRLRLARRALDEAIYADSANDALVEQRAAEVASAQSALIRLRAQTELKIRRVLTPEQLQTFRNLRLRAQRRLRSEGRRRRGPEEGGPPITEPPAERTRDPRDRRRRP